MTATTSRPLPAGLPATAPRHAAPERAAPEVEDRGRLSVDPSVVRKVAERAADLAPGTMPAPRTVAGVGLGSSGASAKVDVAGQRVDLRLALALRYPGPVRSTVDKLRAAVAEEVARTTGYQVRSLAVTVTALLPEERGGLR